eukprot:TRINITY_DN2644_c0_g1_i4.p1 TRINITY_DN2644_c0_g1~~TRINITY_DN2644_c0_g1_i4.p1  ORF type:complete len:173 (+),score=15.03 TRINITY_DN2644_c0_g1_i4:36-521(+)
MSKLNSLQRKLYRGLFREASRIEKQLNDIEYMIDTKEIRREIFAQDSEFSSFYRPDFNLIQIMRNIFRTSSPSSLNAGFEMFKNLQLRVKGLVLDNRSECRTGDISVKIESYPTGNGYMFGYKVTITNHSDTNTHQLLNRHWIIIDGKGQRLDVQGEGVSK